ncbi:DUF6705 family protein [Chryseobacterium sp. C3]|uniref:DUF6705 family protein n=1 Tax=Chryseobacterium sp. C3 TaxID=2761532 RepID=UPI001625D799|nr:DUF6705 family protein [Chryseobacterium sp. C3]
MKTIYLKTIAILLMLNTISCKAQTLPLNTLMEDIPSGAYIKDLNNELTPYIGSYKANFEGNEIILFITKEENKPTTRMSKNFYRDALVVKYIVKNSSGIVLQNTQNMNYDPNQKYHTILSTGTRPTQNIIIFNYRGTNCGIGWGSIYLKKLNSTQISWEYEPNDRVIDSATCPPSVDKTIYLPETKDLIFTKQ